MADVKGRISYIDPNEFAKYHGFQFADSRGDNVSWNPEDLNISVDLQVIIPDRDSCGKDIANNVYVQLQSQDEKFNSFMRGHDLQANENFLTDEYTNISFQEIRENGYGGRESLGIKSIDINFDSHFYPRVTINMTDVRGYSLMQPAEERYREQLNGSKNACENFFSALFHFPYPQFALSVKGYYGDRVTYLLAVTDTNFKFNSQTGNFDVKIDFMGHMYGVYADLPFTYIILAPYFDSDGRNPNRYWDKNVDNGVFRFNDGTKIPTLIQFVKEYERMAENYKLREQRGELGDIVYLTKQASEISAKISNVRSKYDEYIDILKSPTVNEGDYHCIERGGYLFFFTESNIIEFHTNVNMCFNALKESMAVAEVADMGIEIGNEKEWFGSGLEWETERTVQTVLQKECPELANNGPVPEGDKNKRVFVCKSHSDIIEKIDSHLREIANDTKNEQEKAAEEMAKLSQQILGFHPTIENVFRMLFAHIDTFMHYFYATLDQIKSSKRIVKGSGLSLKETDINSKDSEKCFIPPFPALYVDDKKGNKKTKKYPGDIARYAKILKPELDLVNKICESVQSSANFEGVFDSEYRSIDYKKEEDEISQEKKDLKTWEHLSRFDEYLDENPYACFANAGIEDIDNIIYYFICRLYIAWYVKEPNVSMSSLKLDIKKEKQEKVVNSEYNNLMKVCENLLKHDRNGRMKEKFWEWQNHFYLSFRRYLIKHIVGRDENDLSVLSAHEKYENGFLLPVIFYDAYGDTRKYFTIPNSEEGTIVQFDNVKNPRIWRVKSTDGLRDMRYGVFRFEKTIKQFIKKLEETIKDNTQDDSYLDTNSSSGENAVSFIFDVKKAKREDIYYRLKDLYDKWLSGYEVNRFKLRTPQEDRRIADAKYRGTEISNDINEFENFIFVDNFFNDIRDKLIVDPGRLHKIIVEAVDFSAEKSLYGFFSSLAFESRVNFVTLPVYNNIYDAKSLDRIFQPQGLYDGQKSNARSIGNTHVLIYSHEPSNKSITPDDENSSGFQSDYWYIADECGNISIEGLGDLENNSGDNGYHLPVFGVTFGKQNQMYFKSIDLDTSSNKMTDYAVANMLNLAQEAARSGDRANPITMGQNVYSIYSNRQYECTVEMMGCSNIMPLMFFQLNNIPAFKGVYRIYSVSHHIENNTMTTRFVGTRAPKYAIPFNETVIDVSSLIACADELNLDEDGIRGSYGNGREYSGGAVGNSNTGRRNIASGGKQTVATNKYKPHNGEVFSIAGCLAVANTRLTCQFRDGTIVHPTPLKDTVSSHACACAVRQILMGGFRKESPQYKRLESGIGNGYEIKDSLPEIGFMPILFLDEDRSNAECIKILNGETDEYQPSPGDIAVVRHTTTGDSIGHIEFYAGSGYGWISDFRQGKTVTYKNNEKGNAGIIVFQYTGPILYPESIAVQWRQDKGISEGIETSVYKDNLSENSEMLILGGTIVMEKVGEQLTISSTFPGKAEKYIMHCSWAQHTIRHNESGVTTRDDGVILNGKTVNDGNKKITTISNIDKSGDTLLFYYDKK